MQPDNEIHLNQVTGDKTKEFGRTSDEGPGPTKQDLERFFNKYDLLFIPHNIAIRCIGCMQYIWEHEYTPNDKDITSFINDFRFNELVFYIIEHHLSCSFWNK